MSSFERKYERTNKTDPDALGASDGLASEEEQNESKELRVPDKLDMCQWAVIIILYLILFYLVGFIIYISATWDKDRTNEYT